MKRRSTWIAVLVLAAVGVGVIGWRVAKGRDPEVSYRTAVVDRGDVRVQVSATGTLEAVTTVQVGSQVSGTISALYVDFNDQVKEGQVLAQLDPTFLRAAVAQSAADLQRADVQVRQAERDSMRVFALGAQGLSSQVDLDAAKTALDAARASQASARAGVERARTNLRYATISSPISGVVISRDVDVGQTVAASLQAPTLFTIANDLTRMQLEAAVDEADIGQVRVGQAASFTVDAYPDLSFTGRVHQIRLSPEILQNVVTYTVVIHVDNPEQKLLPGMTTNVTIVVDEEKDALRIPSMALRVAAGAAGRGGRAPGAGGSPGGGARPSTMAAQGAGGGPGAQGREGPNGGPGMSAGTGAPGPRVTILVLEDEKKPRAVRVRTGLSDGTFTAVRSDSLREGMNVVVAIEGGSGRSDEQQVVNPFAPRMPGAGARGRR